MQPRPAADRAAPPSVEARPAMCRQRCGAAPFLPSAGGLASSCGCRCPAHADRGARPPAGSDSARRRGRLPRLGRCRLDMPLACARGARLPGLRAPREPQAARRGVGGRCPFLRRAARRRGSRSDAGGPRNARRSFATCAMRSPPAGSGRPGTPPPTRSRRSSTASPRAGRRPASACAATTASCVRF